MADYLRESGVKWLWEKIKTLLSAKQDKLVSGTNIKTINGTSLLGEGDVSISGGSGSDFNSSGTYPNLTAGKATKLATARTISLSGGASGSVSFDGSKDVDIPVTNINEGKMVWDNTYEKSKVSILDTLFRDSFGNKLAYLNPNAIKVEYSRDGGATWLDYGNAIDGTSESINKTRLVTFQCGLGSYYQGKRLQNNEETYTDQLRITIDAIDGDVYFSLKKILIYTSSFVDADNKQVKIETQNYSSSSVDTGLWTTRGIYHIVGQPGWSAIPTTGWPNFGYATSGHIRKVRFTFYQNASSVYRGHVDNIAFLAERVAIGGNTLTKTGHLYTMDESQNATFPANLKAGDFNGVNISVSNNVKGKTLNIGTGATSSNSGTAAIGGSCSATNPYAIAMGYKAVSSSYYSIAMGYEAVSSSYYSIAMGTAVTASAICQTVIGKHNAASNHAFVIGWGTTDAKKNIFSVDTSGNVYGTRFITQNGTANQVVLGDGSLIPLSELSQITDADAEILLDNHIHSINVNANGNNVNISVIESSKNGDTWETEDNDIPIPLATTTSAGVMSKEDKAKLDKMSKVILYTLTEDEYNNHELVPLYNIILAIKNEVFNDATNRWLYDETNSYNICVKGYTGIGSDNGITYANFNVRLLTVRDGHVIGFSGFVDVDNVLETSENADCPLWTGYVCGKYHIENDDMAIHAPENSKFYVEV